MTPSEIANLTVALIALLVSGASLAYAWRAFALQRYSTSSSGLEILHVERFEKISEEPAQGLQVHKVRSYFVSTILSRGPGLRYGATGAVWGEGEFTVLTPQVQVWGPGHPGIEFELKRRPDGTWQEVFCGVTWESPRMFRKGFTTHGYRLKVPAPGSRGEEFLAEQWNPRKSEWRPLRNGGGVETDPLEAAVKKGASFSSQLAARSPDYDWLEEFRRPYEKTSGDD